MPEWHSHCFDQACHWRCQRPDCQRPEEHFLVRARGARESSYHIYDCAMPISAAREIVENLRPGMAPSEIAVARRVLLEALAQLEEPGTRPTIYSERVS